MNEYYDAKRRCRDSLVRAVKKYSQPMERQPSEYFFPINRLPQDVLAEIFVQCLPKFESWSDIEGPSTKGVAPLLLCSVCSSWRKVVLSVPRLWQRLPLRFESITKAKTEEVILLIHEWIKRSGVLPLALSLHVALVVSRGNKDMVEAVLGAVFQYSSRWEYFHYRCIDDAPITFPEFGDMPHLRSFNFSLILCRDLEHPKLQISSWPMLTALSWFLHPMTSAGPSPPWHQLTRLALRCSMKARETLLVIQSCPKLTELEIVDYEDNENEDDILDPSRRGIAVVHNCLRKLYLYAGESCAQLLMRLTLPLLTDMTLYFEASVPRVHKELLRFFTRSKCKLDRLDLMDPDFDDEMLLRCLEHDSCASITDLSVGNVYYRPMVTDPVLVALTDVPDGEVLLPNLAHLEFRMCIDGSPGMLGTMLVSRCILCDEDQLKTVKLICPSLSRPDIVLVALAETHGLKVTLKGPFETENLRLQSMQANDV